MKLTKVQKIVLIMAIILIAGGTAIWATVQYLASEVIYEKGETQMTVQAALEELNGAIPYKITYNANGGSGSMATGAKYVGQNYTVAGSTFTPAEGYYFKEWNTSSDGTGVSYVPGATYSTDKEMTLYAIWAKNTGVLTNIITAKDYGKTINYSQNGITDWKIFYNDGINVFIIPSDYLPIGKVPSGAGMATTGTYQAYWASAPTAQTVTTSLAGSYMFTNWTDYSTNANGRAVSTLLNTSNWTSFVNSSYADYAIGGPTLEMWLASWNQKGYTKLYCDNKNSEGYFVGTSSSPTSTSQKVSSSAGYSDKLYFPYKTSTSGCNGYWLASPSAYDPYALMYVPYDGHVTYAYYNYAAYSVRSVVRLKSGVTGTVGTTVVLD